MNWPCSATTGTARKQIVEVLSNLEDHPMLKDAGVSGKPAAKA